MNKIKQYLFILPLIILLFQGCGKKEEGFDVQFEVPEEVTISSEATSMQFKIMFGKAPDISDKVVLGDPSGKLTICDIISVSGGRFTISLYQGLVSGRYNVYIQRGDNKKLMGRMNVTINYGGGTEDIIVEPEPGATVYGIVACGKKGLKDVVVSDGIEVVKTNKDGVYQLKSNKKHKYVFISVPSGYEAFREGVFPKIHQQLKASSGVAERVDFSLAEAGDQTQHTMLLFGDIHLARRIDDIKQFSAFTKDVNAYLDSKPGDKIYAMTLGDMTWELFWYSNSYALDSYIQDINALKNLSVFHTIGNHDHDMMFAGDFNTVTKYKKLIAPTYYSFNIGKVHYIVLDNIECTNTGAGTPESRHYNTSLVQEQLDWLSKDLSFVPKSYSIAIALHAPVFGDNGAVSMGEASKFFDIIKSYGDVHIFSGHTHKMYNVDKLSSHNLYEHNTGAVCAAWWWTSYLTPGIHIGQDGAPGGYRIVNVSGNDFKWRYKATAKPDEIQFRSYDRNSMSLTAEKYTPKANAGNKAKFEELAQEYVSSSSDNFVYLNIWNYDLSWKIEVKEGDAALNVSRVWARDPLHLVSYTAKRLNANASLSFPTSVTKHMFKVKASSPSTTLSIKVTDRFGDVYKEEMKRPKEFSTDIYINNIN